MPMKLFLFGRAEKNSISHVVWSFHTPKITEILRNNHFRRTIPHSQRNTAI